MLHIHISAHYNYLYAHIYITYNTWVESKVLLITKVEDLRTIDLKKVEELGTIDLKKIEEEEDQN
jgi:hypothetical protein